MVRDRYPEYVGLKTGGHAREDPPLVFPGTGTAPGGDGALFWLRQGGCTEGCGACCEAMVLPIAPAVPEMIDGFAGDAISIGLPVAGYVKKREGFDDWERWLNLHDVFLFEEDGRLWAGLPVGGETPAPSAPAPFADFEAWLSTRGVSLIQKQGAVLAHVPLKCTELTAQRTCGIYGQSQRPQMCATYPMHPFDVEGLERVCTYQFVPITELQPVSRAERRRLQRRKR